MKVTLDSIKAFCFLANPARETFKAYVERHDGIRPQYFVSRYLTEHGATAEALDLWKSAKYIDKIHGNYRKVSLLNAPGQAILEATILAGMCQQIIEASRVNDLESYLDFSSVCGMKIIKEIEQLPVYLFESSEDIFPVISSLDSSYNEYLLTEKTIKHILDQWNKKPIAIHDIEYIYFKEKMNDA